MQLSNGATGFLLPRSGPDFLAAASFPGAECARLCRSRLLNWRVDMRAVVQRVSRASVAVGGETVGAIATGLLVLLGVAHDDTESDAAYLAEKIATLRIFEDTQGKMNLCISEVGGAVLAISQ